MLASKIMDRASQEPPNTASRLIAMAASLVGSAHEVMVVMRSSEEDFRLYSEGVKEPSFPELDRLINLIIREEQKLIEDNRARLAKGARRSWKPPN